MPVTGIFSAVGAAAPCEKALSCRRFQQPWRSAAGSAVFPPGSAAQAVLGILASALVDMEPSKERCYVLAKAGANNYTVSRF
ncbi:MAG: hypothetical protein MUC60_01060 [Oscillatoria sp. Prado101]|nr:hypothetical protein [Oscillatoria sp. Prado101]